MSPPPININKDALEILFCEEYMSVIDIAKHFNVSRDTIYKNLKKHNLTREDNKVNINKLKELYCEKNYNITQLCEYFNISHGNLVKKLKKFNIVNKLKEDITDLYKNNASSKEIAQELSITEEEVNYNLKHHSIYRTKKISITKEELKNLRKTKTTDEIAKYYNCSNRTIHFYCKKWELEYLDRKEYKFDINTIEDLYINQNLTQEQISDLIGCARKTVGNFINESGITKRINISSYETDLCNWLVEQKIDFIANSRKIINPYELDIYIEKYKIAIEICGLYWHSTKVNKNKYHIRDKYKLCKSKGITLITIFEDEILYKKDIVLNRLSSLLKLNKSLTSARKCKIKVISSREGIDFLNLYHIQGAGHNSVYLGAYFEESLVSVMSFSKPSISKGNAKVDYELNRFVNPFNVSGIASKLFKYFIKNYQCSAIVSYADLRWNTGNLYNILGFTLSHESLPNYWYVVRQERKHRFMFTKQKLLSILKLEKSDMTEEQLAEKLDLYRIYDCGNNVYHYNTINTIKRGQ